MPLAPGTTLGPYEILASLGAGGMGEVFRARDKKLKRDVALKVLPDAFSQDPGRMARFQREAEVLASLNHPNIAAIYGLEERALVMELVEGSAPKGPMPFDEAWHIASQIAAALEYAHDKGIIHRDLKPANVKITPDGVVKLLDFGLAKAFSEPVAMPSTDSANSPTLTIGATQVGVILGTAAYMAPEQAKGKGVDKRADVWAFGVVLYELLTGEQLFDGDDVSETLAQVLTKQPDWEKVPLRTRHLLQECLQKDVKQRLRDIGDAKRLVVEDAPPAAAAKSSRLGKIAAWLIASGLAISLAALAFVHFRETPPERPIVRFQIPTPPKTNLNVGSGLKLSPNGKYLAFTGRAEDGRLRIWVQSLDSLDARLIPDSEDAALSGPFWSPDSHWIGFVAGGKLRKVDVAGGPSLPLCDVVTFGGGAWSGDGVIIFGGPPGISRVPQAGGTPVPVSAVQPPKEQSHSFPFFLPDGRHFTYSAGSPDLGYTLYLASIGGKDRKTLLSGPINAQYAQPFTPGEPGHLLFIRDGAFVAQPLDSRTFDLVGEAFPTGEVIGRGGSGGNLGAFSVSPGGALAYRTGAVTPPKSQLMWFNREGKALGPLGPLAPYQDVALSYDGKRAAVTEMLASSGTNIWLLDTAHGVPSQFTFDYAQNLAPVWSPDGTRLLFASDRGNARSTFNIYWKDSRGGNEEPLYKPGSYQSVTDWSSDGQLLMVQAPDPKSGAPDLFVAHLNGKLSGSQIKLTPYLNESYVEAQGQFSPGAPTSGTAGSPRWVAYMSNESGRYETYVNSFPAAGRKFRVSDGGGTQPRWRRDGKELFYLSPSGKLMAVEVRLSPTFEHGSAKELFEPRIGGISTAPGFRYDVASDGKRFLVITRPPTEEAPAPTSITVVLNWTSKLKR